jgi:hypothetical protein
MKTSTGDYSPVTNLEPGDRFNVVDVRVDLVDCALWALSGLAAFAAIVLIWAVAYMLLHISIETTENPAVPPPAEGAG